jgi:hypothetical protein
MAHDGGHPLSCRRYSAPSATELPGARAAYRETALGGLVGFAGEACEEACMTMNAALESGRRAARQVAEQLQTETRRTKPRPRL